MALLIECPRCHCHDTHLIKVYVHARDRGEDATTGILTECDIGCEGGKQPSTVVRYSDMKTNPSPRRDGIELALSCEQCDEDGEFFVATLYQHKGGMYLEGVNIFEDEFL